LLGGFAPRSAIALSFDSRSRSESSPLELAGAAASEKSDHPMDDVERERDTSRDRDHGKHSRIRERAADRVEHGGCGASCDFRPHWNSENYFLVDVLDLGGLGALLEDALIIRLEIGNVNVTDQ